MGNKSYSRLESRVVMFKKIETIYNKFMGGLIHGLTTINKKAKVFMDKFFWIFMIVFFVLISVIFTILGYAFVAYIFAKVFQFVL